MDEGSDFMELLELQGKLEMVTKSELLEHVRAAGVRISDRQLTTYVTEGLIPKSARIGSRAGAYPKLVEDLVVFVSRARNRGLSVQAIRLLLPVWRYLRRALRDGELLLAEFELICRTHAASAEAAYAIPWVLDAVLPCPSCNAREFERLRFIRKDGQAMATPVTIGFVLAQRDEETGAVTRVAQMRMAMPSSCEGEGADSVVLGIPVGVPLPPAEDVDGHGDSDQRRSAVVAG